MSLALGEPRSTEIPCVLGYKPGSDYDLAGQLVILFASYDGLGIDPDGTVFPGANRSASGLAVLLELARVWHEQSLDARRSVMFVAWGVGRLDLTAAAKFLNSDPNFRHLPATALNKPALLIQLDGIGAGGDALCIHPRSSARLSKLMSEAAEQVGVPILAGEGTGVAYGEVATSRVPWVYLGCSEVNVGPDEDRLERVQADKLQGVGEVMALSLTRIVRQTAY
jgi:hypothetical protein